MAYGRRKYRRKSYSRKRRSFRRPRRFLGRHKVGSHPSRNVRSCGQATTLTDSIRNVSELTNSPATYLGQTDPTDALCSTWNHIDTGSERFNKLGDHVVRTGFWMKLRLIRESTETSVLNDKLRVMLWNVYSNTPADAAQRPGFENPVGREFKEHQFMVYDRIHSFIKGFAIAGVKNYRDVWIKLKLHDKLDFHGLGQGDVGSSNLPHKGRLQLHVVCPVTPTAADSIKCQILDWKMYYRNSFS